jgi:hypothetical protein
MIHYLTMNFEAERCSDMLVNFYQTTCVTSQKTVFLKVTVILVTPNNWQIFLQVNKKALILCDTDIQFQ